MAKKILIIDGGPRKKFNLAQLLETFTEGVKSVDASIEVEHVRLYDLDYKGCVSCMGCKLAGGKNEGRCVRKDGLSEVLSQLDTIDGLAIGSPIYYGTITGQLQAALERMTFPYLSYNKMGFVTKNRVPTATFYTMNATPEQAEGQVLPGVEKVEWVIAGTWSQPERVCAFNTCQVRDYSKYDLAAFSPEAKQAWHDAHWEEDKQKAFQAGVNMANKILTL